MFKPSLVGRCPLCDHEVDVRATERGEGNGITTKGRSTDHLCTGLEAAAARGDRAPMQTLLLGAQ